MLMEGHLKLLLPTFKQNYNTIEFTLLPCNHWVAMLDCNPRDSISFCQEAVDLQIRKH